MPFRALEHTADLGIEVWAATLDELFVDAAVALADTITHATVLREAERIDLTVEEPALDLLLVAWLEELLYRFETAGTLVCGGAARVEEGGHGWRVEAKLRGEGFEAARHPLRVTVKAITYHGLAVARSGGEWGARVLFDI
jgi:SHS2 domain-containing protein